MKQISNFQIYCMMLVITAPISFLLTPATQILTAGSAAWLTQLTAVIPGLLLIGIYLYIIKKSPHPFPDMLENCFGKIAGKIIGLLYIIISLFSVSLTLSLFVYFIESNVMPGTPFSVFIGAMLLVGVYAIKTGIENIARVSELVLYIGLPFGLLILLLGFSTRSHLGSLLPVTNVGIAGFSQGVFSGFILLSNLIVVLTLAFLCNKKQDLPRTMFMIVGTYIGLITVTCLVTLVLFPVPYINTMTYPTFKIARGITLGEYIQNLDILFVAIWIMSIASSISIKWFFSCYIVQKVFSLKDYRFLASPTALIVGVGALMLGPNIIEQEEIFRNFVPVLFSLFFILIPAIMAFILAFKPVTKEDLLDSPKPNRVTQ